MIQTRLCRESELTLAQCERVLLNWAEKALPVAMSKWSSDDCGPRPRLCLKRAFAWNQALGDWHYTRRAAPPPKLIAAVLVHLPH